MAVPHIPMQETEPPTQQNYCAMPIITIFLIFYKGEVF